MAGQHEDRDRDIKSPLLKDTYRQRTLTLPRITCAPPVPGYRRLPLSFRLSALRILRVALLTGALTKTKGEPALSLLQPANWQAYGSANRSGHGWRKLVRSAEKEGGTGQDLVPARLVALRRSVK